MVFVVIGGLSRRSGGGSFAFAQSVAFLRRGWCIEGERKGGVE